MIQKIEKVNDFLYLKAGTPFVRIKRPVLLIEDDKVEAMIIKRAFKDINIENKIDIVCNGEEALEYIYNKEIPNPGIVFLDLNMPRMNGLEFLKVIMNGHLLQDIPIVVMSTSDIEKDKEKCFNLNAVGYMVKPNDYKESVELIKTINLFWIMT